LHRRNVVCREPGARASLRGQSRLSVPIRCGRHPPSAATPGSGSRRN
jgi:hypothetical protein